MVWSGRKLLTFWRNPLPSSAEREAADSSEKLVNLEVQLTLSLVLLLK
jgi:hypothetical protein